MGSFIMLVVKKEVSNLKSADFVHLHNHTQYSLLDGLTKIPQLVSYVKELGMEAVAVTDHGLMSGGIELYKEATAADIKPIIGMEAYVAARRHSDKDVVKDRQNYHLTMLAMNNQGYQNLMRLSSIASLEGFYYRPRVDRKLIEKYNQGIIVLSGCMGGEVSDALRQGQYKQAKEHAQWYSRVFGDRYFIEILDHGHANHPSAWAEQTKVNEQLLKLSYELGIPAVVTCDAHYLKHEDQEAHEILLCVQTGSFLTDDNRFSLKDFELHVMDPKDIFSRWGKTHPELIRNSKKIADRCQVKIELGKILIPTFPTPKGQTEQSLLAALVWQGLAWRYGKKNRADVAKLKLASIKKLLSSEVIARAEYELKIVNKMGFNGYFLIVADFINWGKDNGIVFGPGRGSAASSILAYSLRITEIDPLKYDLLFERFLNPERISMPDMDIDIQDSRRDEVIQYCIDKYGRDQVANIVTFGRMAARNSVRDVARVLQVPYSEADRLAKMIPPPLQGRHTPLIKHIAQVPDLKSENANNPQAARVFELAVKLEGTIRSHGVHAAGVVIAPSDLVKYVPLEMAQKGVIATQYSMLPVEELGLLKMDFLGLSNLTTIKNTLRIVKKVYGDEFDIADISLEDKITFELLQRGETTGVFQLESAGMRRYLKQLKPTVFEDIIAMVALYRPGPMQWIDDFIARKHGQRKIEYIHPVMKSSLENTYGVMVYQEQAMQIAKDMCGFSGGEADTLRQAVGKKKRDLMAKMKDKVIKGAMANNIDAKIAEKFWTTLESFADYGFNKVHSACYGLIAYQTAFLKAHYPDAFMAALMTSDFDNIDRLAIEIAECRKMGIEVLAPDVNQSFHEFAIVPNKSQIRFGLDAIKNVGHGAAEEILRARSENSGQFADLVDFFKHVDSHTVNRKVLESLIKTGALDSFGVRTKLLANIEALLAFSNRVQKDAASGQVDLFGGNNSTVASAQTINLAESDVVISPAEQQKWERDLLGLYLSKHPLEDFKNILNERTIQISKISSDMDGQVTTVGGTIEAIRQITTKTGSQMAFIKLADISGEIELIVFPKLYTKYAPQLERDTVIIASGKLNGRDRFSGEKTDETKLLVEKIELVLAQDAGGYKLGSKKTAPTVAKKPKKADAGDQENDPKKRLYIRIENSGNQALLIRLKEKLDSHSGETEVVIVTGPSELKEVIKLPQTININEQSLRDLASMFGSTNVVIR